MFLFQLLQLVVAEAKVFKLFKLVAEQLMASALLVAGVGQSLKLLVSLAPALGGQVHLAGKVRGAGVFVEQAAMGVGLEQRLMFVLAVDVDQQLTEGLEVA
ncbi:hypothetical protein D9M71_773090 [compost metagenome]